MKGSRMALSDVELSDLKARVRKAQARGYEVGNGILYLRTLAEELGEPIPTGTTTTPAALLDKIIQVENARAGMKAPEKGSRFAELVQQAGDPSTSMLVVPGDESVSAEAPTPEAPKAAAPKKVPSKKSAPTTKKSSVASKKTTKTTKKR